LALIISIFSGFLTLLYVGIVLFFRKGWSRIPEYRVSGAIPSTRVSILIAARNEEDKIGATLSDIIAQNYPRELLEVIVVDDHSTDRTSCIVQSYADQGVKLIRLNEKEALNSYKKKAISEAIKLAEGELIVTTDADCRMGTDWLRTIALFYEEKDLKLVSSPVAYFREQSVFEEVQTLEFLFLIGLGASTIGNGMPSTCNGANLAYRKDVFLELDGFTGIDELASGDDELFLHKVAARYPEGIGFCKAPAAVVYTYAKETLSELLQQRKRWASKSTRYKNKWVVALGVSIWLFNVSILLNVILGFILPTCWTVALFAMLLKVAAELYFLVPLVVFIRRVKLLGYLPILSVIHILYMIFIGVAGNSGNYNWKGRSVK
jgi:cellulose synthase/poly-beta-1,6-N-acetylglucosamine synthase-like glycosyltransferase